jgi:hypothetical protein
VREGKEERRGEERRAFMFTELLSANNIVIM